MDNIEEDILQQNEDRISRYLTGQMSQEEESTFETDLSNDIQLKAQAETMARMAKAMNTIGVERDKEYISQMKSAVTKKTLSFRWVSVAASFALLVTVGYQAYEYNRIGNLGKEYAMTFPVSTIVRGEENEDVTETLTTLFNNVANCEDLKNTITQLNELWKLSQSDTYNDYTTYAPYIGWNLAIAHLRNHDKKNAKSVLTDVKLNSIDNPLINSKTTDLLTELL